jgi:hypothetical protein
VFFKYQYPDKTFDVQLEMSQCIALPFLAVRQRIVNLTYNMVRNDIYFGMRMNLSAELD